MNIVIKNIMAVLPHKKGLEVKNADIYIKNDRIESIGKEPKNFIAEKTIEGNGKLVIPGLVNCHTHSYMSIFRNLADDLSFEDWLFKNIDPMEQKLTMEDAYWGSMLGCIEMIKSGTTTFVDMHMFKNQIINAVDKTGMRAVISRGLVGAGNNDDGSRRLKEAREEIEYAKDMERISFMLSPHAIYTCDTEYLEIVIEEAKKLNVGLNIHVSETEYEVAQSQEKYGKTPVKYLSDLGFFDRNTIAAHCVHITEEDIEILADKKVHVALNPKSNLKLGNGIAPAYQMLNKGVNLCIGTDSMASNNSLNLFGDMNYTALLHKGTNKNAQAITANEVLKFATENGGKAIGIDTGIIKEGMKADLAIINLDYPQFYPRHNLIAALSYSANGSEIESVIINGEIVLENRKMTRIDEEEVYAKANEILKRLKA